MMNAARAWSTLLVLASCVAPTVLKAAEDTASQDAAARALAKLLPLGEDVPRSIMNPYHAQPAWKLWVKERRRAYYDKAGRKPPIPWGQKPTGELDENGVALYEIDPDWASK